MVIFALESYREDGMNETLKTIHSQTSTHGGFSAEAPSADELDAVLAAAVRAPSASARQAYSIVAIDDRKKMRALCGYEAGALLLFSADYNRIVAEAAATGHSFSPGGLGDFITAATDALLAAQNAALAATSLGLDTLFTNGIYRVGVDAVYEIAGLPERLCFPLIALLVGRRAGPEHPPRGRIGGAGVVHRGRYRLPEGEELDGIVAAYDDPGLRLGLAGDWTAQGFAHYLDWFFEKWTVPARDEDRMRSRLERAGFIER
jgi:nitroreductase